MENILVDTAIIGDCRDGITIETARWHKDQFKGDRIETTSDGHETTAKVVSNDDKTLEVDSWSDGTPDAGAEYSVIGNTVPPDISAEDIALAIVLFYEEAPSHFNGILTNENGWKWDAQKQQYIQPSGQPLSDGDLKALALLVMLAVEEDMRAEAAKVAAGTTPIGEWQDWQAEEAKRLYIALGALGAGGEANLTSEIRETIQGSPDKAPGIAYSLARLELFASDIADGSDGTVETIVNRGGMYADAGNAVTEAVRRVSHQNAVDEAGRPLFLFERNNLTPGENCSDGDGTIGCIQETEKNWVPIGELTPPGARTCNFRCKCWLSYSLTGLDS